ncbi:hypothetical protein L2D14_08015 [Thalassospiraceae bacterium LMO-JJ14]|nr:hypothetical protein L2D14_08015 [Thalassospiraceae bacterium LMO-JJ14]
MQFKRLPYYVLKAAREPGLALRLLALQLILLKPLARLTYALFGHRFLGRIAALAVDATGTRQGVPNVLCSSRLLFDKDIVQLRRLATQFNWLVVDSGYLSLPQEQWLPPELCIQRSYVAHRQPRHLAAWDKSAEFVEVFLERVQTRHRLSAVIGSNFDYWQEEGLRLACRRLGIPFLVVCQEHLTIPYYGPINIEEIRSLGFSVPDTAIAVFGQSTKDYIAKAGVCADERIVVTGAPRFDAWFNAKQPAPVECDTLTLLSYADPSYLAPGNFIEALHAFCDAAAACPDPGLRFVVKCKSPDDRDTIRAMVERKISANVTFQSDIPLPELLSRSRLVAGFNSLAQIEALLSPALLVCPQWGDADRPEAEMQINPNDPRCQSHFVFPRSATEFDELLRKACQRDFTPPGISEGRMELFQLYFHVPTGTSASEAIQDFVHHFIGQGESA